MTLIFVHGAGFTGDAFAPQVQAFENAHFPNLPGHLCPGRPRHISDFAEFMEAYAAEHANGDAVLCGHSMGGAAAIEVALRRRVPLRALILIGSGARLRVAPAILEEVAADFQTAILRIATYFFAEPTEERVAWAVDFMRSVGPAQTLRDFQACNDFDALARLGDLSVPLLALTGEADRMTAPKFAHALADRVPGAQARIIPAAGHFVMVEQPEATNAEIAAFLSGVS